MDTTSKRLELNTPRCDRQYHWISSTTGEPEVLSALSQQMMEFYSQQSSRQPYQEMVDEVTEPPAELDYIRNLNPASILEIGCGSGRIYRHLRNSYTGRYSGIEVADYVIKQNQQLYPEAVWKCASAYEIPFAENSFDVCFSMFVIEHLVYPERALREMFRVIKQGGKLVLWFPDFAQSGRYAAQLCGFSPSRASEKLRSGKVIDALVSLYDSRWRLPRAMKSAVKRVGSFPINTRPICLSHPSLISEDFDAVYISSKEELHNWAVTNGYTVEYPYGTEGVLREIGFMAITK